MGILINICSGNLDLQNLHNAVEEKRVTSANMECFEHHYMVHLTKQNVNFSHVNKCLIQLLRCTNLIIQHTPYLTKTEGNDWTETLAL